MHVVVPVFFYCWIQLQYFCGKVTVFEYLCHVVDAHRTDETKKWFALNNKGMEKKRKGLVCLRTGFVLFGVKLAFDMSVIQLHCIFKWKKSIERNFYSFADFVTDCINPFATDLNHNSVSVSICYSIGSSLFNANFQCSWSWCHKSFCRNCNQAEKLV